MFFFFSILVKNKYHLIPNQFIFIKDAQGGELKAIDITKLGPCYGEPNSGLSMTPSPVTPDFSPPLNGGTSHPLEAVHKSVDSTTGAEHLAAPPPSVISKRVKEVQETEEGSLDI